MKNPSWNTPVVGKDNRNDRLTIKKGFLGEEEEVGGWEGGGGFRKMFLLNLMVIIILIFQEGKYKVLEYP